MKSGCYRAVVWLALGLCSASLSARSIVWDELPPLLPSAGQPVQPGVAGPFVGAHGNVLLVAGGANFPDRMPWDGGAKVWWDDLWVLEKTGGGVLRWVTDKTFKLPRRLGYGISVSMPDGVVCAGGHDAERAYADVFLLSWDARTREIKRTPLPPLPEPLTFMAGALVGDTLYVAGGQHVMKGAVPTSVFWALDFSQRSNPERFTWASLPAWPGPARVLPVAAGQGAGRSAEFFLFSGRVPQAGRATEILRDAYAFNPATRTWRTLPNVGGGAGVSVMAGTAAPWGDEDILVFGGDRGDPFLELEAHDLAMEKLRAQLTAAVGQARATIVREIEAHLTAKKVIYAAHAGFGREVFAFNVRTNSWRVVTSSTVAPQVTTVAVTWEGGVVIPSGEIKPGVRTPAVVRARVVR